MAQNLYFADCERIIGTKYTLLFLIIFLAEAVALRRLGQVAGKDEPAPARKSVPCEQLCLTGLCGKCLDHESMAEIMTFLRCNPYLPRRSN